MGPRGIHRGAADHLEGLSRAAAVCLKAKKRLQQAAKALSQYTRRLNGLAARKRITAPGVRQAFLAEAASIQLALKSLRGALVCADDARQM